MTGKGKTLKVDVFRQDEKQRGKNRSPEGETVLTSARPGTLAVRGITGR